MDTQIRRIYIYMAHKNFGKAMQTKNWGLRLWHWPLSTTSIITVQFLFLLHVVSKPPSTGKVYFSPYLLGSCDHTRTNHITGPWRLLIIWAWSHWSLSEPVEQKLLIQKGERKFCCAKSICLVICTIISYILTTIVYYIPLYGSPRITLTFIPILPIPEFPV